MTVAEFVAAKIDAGQLNQKKIADALGYPRPNVVSMMKLGQMKIPLGKIDPLAKAIGADPAELMRMTLFEYMPESLEAIEGIFGLVPSPGEQQVLKELRKLLDGPVPHPLSEEQQEALLSALKPLTDVLRSPQVEPSQSTEQQSSAQDDPEWGTY